jgi:hypothetical protein
VREPAGVRLGGADRRDQVGDQLGVARGRLIVWQDLVGLVEQVVPGDRGLVRELPGHPGDGGHECVTDAVGVGVEVAERRLHRGRALPVARRAAGGLAVGDGRPLGRPVPADGRLAAGRASGARGSRDELAVGVLVEVDDGVDAAAGRVVDRGADAVDVVLVERTTRRLESRPRHDQPYDREPVRRHPVPVVGGRWVRRREVGIVLVVIAEGVEVGTAQQDVAAPLVDDPGPPLAGDRQRAEVGDRRRGGRAVAARSGTVAVPAPVSGAVVARAAGDEQCARRQRRAHPPRSCPHGPGTLGGRADRALAAAHAWRFGAGPPAPQPADRHHGERNPRRRDLTAHVRRDGSLGRAGVAQGHLAGERQGGLGRERVEGARPHVAVRPFQR